ncbi:hypothetical protein [Salmonella enterica]|nr:hypothetical protein [Salmonella enterica]MDO3920408.1 hypothetical protein [Salmonella enterica]
MKDFMQAPARQQATPLSKFWVALRKICYLIARLKNGKRKNITL